MEAFYEQKTISELNKSQITSLYYKYATILNRVTTNVATTVHDRWCKHALSIVIGTITLQTRTARNDSIMFQKLMTND